MQPDRTKAPHMSRFELEERADEAKRLFDFLSGWTAPSVGGLDPPLAKEYVLRTSDPIIMQLVLQAVGPQEREILKEWILYRRKVWHTAGVVDGGHGSPERVFANIYDALIAQYGLGGWG